MRNCLASLLLLLLTVSTSAQGISHRALFIGNSYTAFNNLPGMVANLATANGDTLIHTAHTPGGNTLQQHAGNGTVANYIAQGNWDYVVMQEQSQRPSFPPGQVATEVLPYAEQLCNDIRAANPCTEPVFYMTWGRKFGDALNCPVWPPVCTYSGMQQRLRDSYLLMGNNNEATVSPVGVAWRTALDSGYVPDLYTSDGSHPSHSGSYLASCVFYATLFQKSPVGNTYHYTLNATDAAFLQDIAAQIVFDSAATWRINANHVLAGFTTSSVGQQVQFTDTSTNATNWHYDFGDGSSTTNPNPTHTYTNPGNYTVCMVATDSCTSDTVCQTINVSCVPPTADFGDNSNSGGTIVNFSNLSISGSTYSWDYGDGTPISTQSDPAHQYSTSGLYEVCLIATNQCGSDTLCTLISVGCSLPMASFGQSSSNYTASFTDNSFGATGVAWDFGDGSNGSGISVTHQYAALGTYTVCQYVSNVCGSDTICQQITISCPPPFSGFVANVTQLMVDFSNISTNGTSYSWDFGDGFTSSAMDAQHTYAVEGDYVICLTTANACGANQFCDTISLSCPPPVPNFTSTDSNLVASFTDQSTGATNWSWEFGDGGSSTVQNPVYAYAAAGTYTVTLTVSSDCGSEDFSTAITLTTPPDTNTGIATVSAPQLVLWPNPAHESITLSGLPKAKLPAQVRLHDVAGRLVMEARSDGNGRIELPSLPGGFYWISVPQLNQLVRLPVIIE